MAVLIMAALIPYFGAQEETNSVAWDGFHREFSPHKCKDSWHWMEKFLPEEAISTLSDPAT